MKKCAQCGTHILFGPVREGTHLFCSYKCRDEGISTTADEALPDEFVYKKACEIRSGDCPKCGGGGPVEFHTSHRVWSILVMSSFNSKPEICCDRCGRRAKWGAVLFCSLFGWWGFPFGLVGTPVQIARNLGGLRSSSAADRPSDKLCEMVRSGLAVQLMSAPAEPFSTSRPGEL